MKTLRRLALFCLCGLLGSCSSGLLAPSSVREAEFIEKTTVKSATSYQQALRWFDKNLHALPGSDRIQEPDTGHMQIEAAYQCNVLRKESDLKDYFLGFELDFDAKPGFISLRFTEIQMQNELGELISKPEFQISSVQNMERVRPCLKKMVASILKAVEKNTVTW